jgi:hypothetical protein
MHQRLWRSSAAARWRGSDPIRSGAFGDAAMSGKALVAQHRVFSSGSRTCNFVDAPKITLTRREEAEFAHAGLRIQFAWGVCLDIDGELPVADNCFDLLPGIAYHVPWPDSLPAPRVIRVREPRCGAKE